MHIPQLDQFWRIKVDGRAWQKLLHHAYQKKYSKGEIVFFEGEKVEVLCYLQTGSVRIVRFSPEGVEKIIMHVEENALFGETPFFTEKRLLSTFICHKDAVVWFFPKKSVYDEILPNHPEIARDIIKTLAEKLDVLSNQSASLVLDSLCLRICKFIYLKYQEDPNENGAVDLTSIKMQDIASILGVHRITLYKAIKELETLKVIELASKNRLKILDIDGLKTLMSD